MHCAYQGRRTLHAVGGGGESLLLAASAQLASPSVTETGGQEAREREAAVTDRSDAHAVVVTGAYGTGKTSLVEEIADILERRHVRYGALDLDWLGWFDPGFGDGDHDAGLPVKLKNVDAVVGNYYETGVRRFAMAGSMASPGHVAALRDVLGMPLFVVRLTLPIDEIERRLSSFVTAGRKDDLEVARAQVAEGRGGDVGDLVIENDRPIREVATEVLSALGW